MLVLDADEVWVLVLVLVLVAVWVLVAEEVAVRELVLVAVEVAVGVVEGDGVTFMYHASVPLPLPSALAVRSAACR